MSQQNTNPSASGPSLFEQASRSKLRFESQKGLLSTEDLWDLPLSTSVGTKVSLDSIATDLYRKVQNAAPISFVGDSAPSAAAAKDTLAFEVVKAVIDVKKAENAARVAQQARQAQKARILELLGKKEDAELEGKSREELQALLDTL